MTSSDLTFDAFDTGGGGALVSWMLASGNEDALDPVVETIHALVDELTAEDPEAAVDARAMAESTLTLVLLAFGDALIGERLAASLGLARGEARERAEKLGWKISRATAGSRFARIPRPGAPAAAIRAGRRVDILHPEQVDRLAECRMAALRRLSSLMPRGTTTSRRLTFCRQFIRAVFSCPT